MDTTKDETHRLMAEMSALVVALKRARQRRGPTGFERQLLKMRTSGELRQLERRAEALLRRYDALES